MAKKKSKTKAEKAHMNKVAELGCIACRILGYEDTPPTLHHIRANAGAGQKASHFDVIPLCPEHHQNGKNAIHQSKVNFERDFGTELELLEMVKGLLNIAA
jgi:hypothetical protein